MTPPNQGSSRTSYTDSHVTRDAKPYIVSVRTTFRRHRGRPALPWPSQPALGTKGNRKTTRSRTSSITQGFPASRTIRSFLTVGRTFTDGAHKVTAPNRSHESTFLPERHIPSLSSFSQVRIVRLPPCGAAPTISRRTQSSASITRATLQPTTTIGPHPARTTLKNLIA